MAEKHSLITIPPEINRLILELLSSHDFIALRHTSRDFYRYFASQDISHFAHKLFFPLSSESKRAQRTRYDFDCAYERSQRWKEGRPSNITIINEVADGSASLSNGFLVDTENSLLAYQRARAIVVLKDLQCTDDSTDVIIDLEKLASPCMGARNEGMFLKDGESVRIAANRGMLLCVGEAHIHPSRSEGFQSPPGKTTSIFSSIWNWTNPPPRTTIPPRQFFEHPHSACAVFSTKKEDRGRLIASWFERDSFIWMIVVNEFYALAEFDLVEQRLEGYIYPTADHPPKKIKDTLKGCGNRSDGKHDGHHFTIKKKSLYPPLSTFSIAADTRGKVFYLGFLPPSAERRPVVEVHAVPQYDPSNKSWSPCTVIKRITLRSLGRHAGELNGSTLNSSFWINFDPGTTVKELKGPKMGPLGSFTRDPDEDVVRIRMTGDLYIPGITGPDEQVSMVTWDITARASPHKPSTITEWRSGKEWDIDPESEIDFDTVSLYKNAEGKVDFEELYPSPTYYTRHRRREAFMTELSTIPRTVDFDCMMANNEIGVMPSLFWVKDSDNKNKSACAVYGSMEQGILVRDPKPDNADNSGMTVFMPHHEAVEFPLDPGRNDKDFIPAGIHIKATYKVTLDVGRNVTIRKTAKPVPTTTPPPPPSPKRKSRFFGKIWTDYIYQHRVNRANNRIAATGVIATDTIDGVSSDSSETMVNNTSAFVSVDLPFPGMEEHREKILTKMDHGDKRYWVYGKEAETIDKGLPSQTRVGDKIVIVRFD
ncbi:hypothetical protein P167DRAFT_604948 [Morchella conica CCBAS932]|uniref:F-box domain-containing protein n=1 Tax=Morchella conica CCBAS932 TaxID=1392247 RepID=A0A3N4L5L4_9PEZI|nr:hypothetical protein P167DRAFT_604948 [Morchella conica CCBAS932]